jgi:drug/metabolite transporter (DMT)-like permease
MDTAINTHSEKKLYGKRPVWQWVAIYLVIGAVVYSAIYFIILNKGYGYTNASYSSQQTQQQNPY